MLTESHARRAERARACGTSRSATCSNGRPTTTPDRIALIAGVPDRDKRRQWTYAELYAQAQRTARALRTRFEPGERVAIWAHNIPEWIMVEFGAAMAGVILVTVNPGLRPSEVEYILNQSRSAGLLVVREFRGTRMRDTALELAPKCKELREIICFDDWEAFLAVGRQGQPAAAGGQVDRCGDDPVHLRHHRFSQRRAAAPSRPRQQRRAHQRPLRHRPTATCR